MHHVPHALHMCQTTILRLSSTCACPGKVVIPLWYDMANYENLPFTLDTFHKCVASMPKDAPRQGEHLAESKFANQASLLFRRI